MKRVRLIGVILILCGLLSFFLGSHLLYKDKFLQDDRKFAIATVSQIRIGFEDKDSYTTSIVSEIYVNFYDEGELFTRKLDDFRFSYEIGDQVEIYYYTPYDKVVHAVNGVPITELFVTGLGLLFLVLGCHALLNW